MAKYTVEFSKPVEDQIARLMQSKGVSSKAEIIKRALAVYDAIEKNMNHENGDRLAITDKTDHVKKELVLP
jgi:hypothetical protein